MKTPVTSSVDMMPPDLTVPVMFGRPNITGASGTTGTSCLRDMKGAFYNTFEQYGTENASTRGQDLHFAASRSNSTYGDASTVQPASVRLISCIKI